MSDLVFNPRPYPPEPSLSLREQSAVDLALEQGFCDKYKLHLAGTVSTGLALVWLLGDFGSLPRLGAWFCLVVASVGFMANSYRCAPGPPSSFADFDPRAVSTLVNALVIGGVGWLDMAALSNSTYAYAMCACLVAFAGGTVANLQPMSFLIKLTVFPALIQAGLALLVAGQVKPAFCVVAFLMIVGFRPLDHGRQQLEGVVRQRERETWRAEHDPMTGLWNRAGIERYVGANQTLLFLDVDSFKEINDRFGHSVGDRVLFGIGRRVLSIVGPVGGTVARVGGDEFLIVLSGLDRPAVDRVVDQVLGSLHDTRDLGAPVTVSIGIAQAGTSLEAAMVSADAALYDAKADPETAAVWAA